MVIIGLAGFASGQRDQGKEPPKFTSKAATEAESDYQEEVSRAEAAYREQLAKARSKLISRLERAKDEAAKAVQLDEAILIRDRIRALSERAASPAPEPKETEDRRRLAESIRGSSWVGSKLGLVRFGEDGLIRTSRADLKPWRWAAVDKNTLLARYEEGDIDVFIFSPNRETVVSYGLGKPKQEQVAWRAERVKVRNGAPQIIPADPAARGR